MEEEEEASSNQVGGLRGGVSGRGVLVGRPGCPRGSVGSRRSPGRSSNLVGGGARPPPTKLEAFEGAGVDPNIWYGTFWCRSWASEEVAEEVPEVCQGAFY